MASKKNPLSTIKDVAAVGLKAPGFVAGALAEQVTKVAETGLDVLTAKLPGRSSRTVPGPKPAAPAQAPTSRKVGGDPLAAIVPTGSSATPAVKKAPAAKKAPAVKKAPVAKKAPASAASAGTAKKVAVADPSAPVGTVKKAAAKKAPAKKAPAKKAPANPAPTAKKAPAETSSPAGTATATPVKAPAAKKTPAAKKAPAKKAPAKKASGQRSPAAERLAQDRPVNVVEAAGIDPAPVDVPDTKPVTSIDAAAADQKVDVTPADIAPKVTGSDS